MLRSQEVWLVGLSFLLFLFNTSEVSMCLSFFDRSCAPRRLDGRRAALLPVSSYEYIILNISCYDHRESGA